MNIVYRSMGVLTFAFGLAACGGSDDPEPPPPAPEVNTVVDVAVDNGNFTTLVELLQETGLDETLDNPDGNFTVFAPTDDAFALLGDETLAALLEDPDTLSDILLYHVVTDELDSTAAVGAAGTTLEMANGDSTGISYVNETLRVNLSIVTMANVEADNGVIHVLDAVLMPPTERGEPTENIVDIAAGDENFSTLVAALVQADLDTVLADEGQTFTVFAPTNAAFEALGMDNVEALLGDPEALDAALRQHVIPGAVNSISAYAANGTSVETASGAEIPVSIEDKMLKVGGATVTMTDIYASNGVVHVIDTVITGDVDLPAPPMSIVDVAVEDGNFTRLAEALVATGLDETLADLEESFTVFAPTDDAFSVFSQEEFDALLADTDTLRDILLYHVVSGSEILAADAIAKAQSDEPKVAMANGDMAGLSLSGESLLINLSTVISPNNMADNGIIHAVNKIIMPPADKGEPTDTIVETAINNGSFTQLVDALVATGLDATLANENETFTVFAPTDAAFDALPDGVVAGLSNAELTQVLLQHVIVGAEVDSVTAFTLNGTSVDTESGEDVTLEIVDGELQIQGSTITMYDVYTSNGVIHVIDTVITETLE